jgi:hypothetical protein
MSEAQTEREIMPIYVKKDALGRSEICGNGIGWDPLTAAKNVFTSVPIASALFGTAGGAAAAAVTAATKDQSRPGKKGGSKKAGKPPANEEGPDTAPDIDPTTGAAAPSSQTASVGLESHSDRYIEGLIEGEACYDKKQRMIYSHCRAKRSRQLNSTTAKAFNIVGDVIGQLFARTPVNARSQPSMTKDQIGAVINRLARIHARGAPPTMGNFAAARKLAAAYVRTNKIATPGLKTRRA